MKQTEPSEDMLLEYIRGNAPHEVRAEVEAWMGADPENEAMLLDMARVYYMLRRAERIRRRNVTSAYENVMRSVRRKQQTIRFSWRKVAVAAVVLVAVNIGIWGLVGDRVSAGAYITLNSNAEKKVEYTLPDGTSVFLNRNSSLRFPVKYAKDSRCVKLDGEAYFEVAHDPDKPFVVMTDNDLQIRVLGTKFNVEAYAADSIAQVFLLEGRVSVDIGDNSSGVRNYLMTPSEELRYNVSSGQIALREDPFVSGIEWMDNTFVFRDTPFPEVIRRLSHNFGVEFVVQDAGLNDYTFTGTFDNRDLSLILEYMQISSGIDVRYESAVAGKQCIILNQKKRMPKT